MKQRVAFTDIAAVHNPQNPYPRLFALDKQGRVWSRQMSETTGTEQHWELVDSPEVTEAVTPDDTTSRTP